MQQHRTKAGASGESQDPARCGTSEANSSEHKSRSSSHPPQQEVAVRPKETIVSKRKGVSGVNSTGGGVLVRLGGGVSLSLEEAGKGMYKSSGSSPSPGSKTKLAQSNKGSCGSSSGLGGKHPSAKRRTSSEDSSLEPDMAELSLDDGSSLALGAEASNTFDFLPPPPEMLPSPSPLLREPRKFGSGGASKDRPFETKRAPQSAPDGHACFSKENAMTVPVVVAMEKEVEGDLDENGGDEDPVDDAQPSASANGKAQRGRREGDGSGASGGSPGPQAAEAVAGGDAVGDDDYQAYYLSAASEEGAERGVADSNHEEEPDIFAGIKPLEQEGRMEVKSFFKTISTVYCQNRILIYSDCIVGAVRLC